MARGAGHALANLERHRVDLGESADRSLSPPIRQSTPGPKTSAPPHCALPTCRFSSRRHHLLLVSPQSYASEGYFITFDSDTWRDLDLAADRSWAEDKAFGPSIGTKRWASTSVTRQL